MGGRCEAKVGLAMGLAVVLLFSGVPACISLGGQRIGAWQFVALTGLLGGGFQLVFRAIARKGILCCVTLPGHLWLLVIFGFVQYSLVYPWAMIASVDETQACTVNLINYLWPVLTVVFALFWVPGTHFTRRLALALPMALAGVVMTKIRELGLGSETGAGGSPHGVYLLPYVLGGVSAVTWAAYSSLLARWKEDTARHPTQPVGLFIVALVAFLLCRISGEWRDMDSRAWLTVVLCGVGAYGMGFMLWELALQRVAASTLGFLAAFIPALSTLALCLANGYRPSNEIIGGAMLITLAVLVSVKWRKADR